MLDRGAQTFVAVTTALEGLVLVVIAVFMFQPATGPRTLLEGTVRRPCACSIVRFLGVSCDAVTCARVHATVSWYEVECLLALLL